MEWRRLRKCWRTPARKICSERRWRWCDGRRASTRRNEKTSSRLPLPVIQPGRLGVRLVPEVRPGEETALRVDQLGRFRQRPSGVGAGGCGYGNMSEVLCYGGKRGTGGGV